MLDQFNWSDDTGGYVNSNGDGVDITKEIEKRAGGLIGGDFGLPIGMSWGNCKDFLPEFMCNTPKWVYMVLAVIIIVLIIKLIRR